MSRDPADADVQSMEPTRDERKLLEVKEKALRVVSRDDFNLPARYHALAKLEAILRQRVSGASLLCPSDSSSMRAYAGAGSG
jgi:hypothetical protein